MNLQVIKCVEARRKIFILEDFAYVLSLITNLLLYFTCFKLLVL